MKLYLGPGPNSDRVRIFLAEKSIDLPVVPIDFGKREHKSAEFLKLNSLGQVPVLQLDDGEVITESVAICRYVEAIHPSPPLFGSDAPHQGKAEMWNRRMDGDDPARHRRDDPERRRLSPFVFHRDGRLPQAVAHAVEEQGDVVAALGEAR